MIDLEVYKTALERYNKKNNFLLEKWTKALYDVDLLIDGMYALIPSDARESYIRANKMVRDNIQHFIDDLKAPPDRFFTDEELSHPLESTKQMNLFSEEH